MVDRNAIFIAVLTILFISFGAYYGSYLKRTYENPVPEDEIKNVSDDGKSQIEPLSKMEQDILTELQSYPDLSWFTDFYLAYARTNDIPETNKISIFAPINDSFPRDGADSDPEKIIPLHLSIEEFNLLGSITPNQIIMLSNDTFPITKTGSKYTIGISSIIALPEEATNISIYKLSGALRSQQIETSNFTDN